MPFVGIVNNLQLGKTITASLTKTTQTHKYTTDSDTNRNIETFNEPQTRTASVAVANSYKSVPLVISFVFLAC